MIGAINGYFDISGYAGYVWSAYGLAAVVLSGVAFASWRALKRRRKTLATLQAARATNDEAAS